MKISHIRFTHRVLALAAVLFGLITIITGTRVLAGSDPGYMVFLPLLLYNTTMGVAYIAAGITMWGNLTRGKYAAATIFVLNFLVLGIISYLHTVGTSVAFESVLAMLFRTSIWFVIFFGLAWMCRKNILSTEQNT